LRGSGKSVSTIATDIAEAVRAVNERSRHAA
jgi:hypothetical protein